jgi:hypothetical protein
MKKKLGLWVVFYSLCLTMIAYAATDPLDNPAQQKVKGTIDKITSDQISLKTDEGQTRSFTIAPVNQKEITVKGLKPGDRVLLSYSQENQVTEIKLDPGAGGAADKPTPLTPNPAP